MKSKFAPGDQVVCIDSSCFEKIKKDEVYTVVGVGSMAGWIALDTYVYKYPSHLFRHVVAREYTEMFL